MIIVCAEVGTVVGVAAAVDVVGDATDRPWDLSRDGPVVSTHEAVRHEATGKWESRSSDEIIWFCAEVGTVIASTAIRDTTGIHIQVRGFIVLSSFGFTGAGVVAEMEVAGFDFEGGGTFVPFFADSIHPPSSVGEIVLEYSFRQPKFHLSLSGLATPLA